MLLVLPSDSAIPATRELLVIIDIAFNIKIYCNTQSGIERFIGWLRFITIKICVSEVKSFIVIINGGIGYVQSEYVTIVPIVVKVSSDSVIEL